MTKVKTSRISRRVASIILSLTLCLTLLPVGVFAEGEDEGYTPAEEVSAESADVEAADVEETEETTTEEASDAELTAQAEDTEVPEDQPAPVVIAAPKTARSFKISGYSVKFKSDVLVEQNLNKNAAPKRARITGNRNSIKVSWTKTKATSAIDGYIILRRAGKTKTYTEIKRVGKSTASFTDKTAKKKNTVYTYIVTSYKKDSGKIHISPCTSWASGVTTRSKLKNGYKATISKTSANLQVGGTVTLKIKYSKPKTIQSSSSFRWSSDNSKIAKVSKGKVTAVAPGATVIRGLTASGREYKCEVKVVGAFKPGKPTVSRDYSTTESIGIMWGKTKHATSYDVYCSEADSDNYVLLANVTGTEYLHEGLTKDQLYSYIVQARNDNNEYTAFSSRSDALDLKAVKTCRQTRVSGFPSKKTVKSRSHCKLKIKVTAPDSRTAVVQQYVDKKWKDTKVKVELPEGIGTETVTVTLPDTWWEKETTSWRLKFPKSSGATAYTTGAFKLTTGRYYQNPKPYVQITNKISKHGHSYYTAPVLVNNASTKKDHIDAMIKTARKYLGDPYVVCQSRAPGKGVDCSGLVMQACYGAGVDLWPSNPYRHRSPAYEWESRNIAKHSNLKTVPYKDRKRGDLIFYANSNGVVIHVAIYIGNNKIIHSALSGVHITGMKYPYGHVCKVKRIFN